MTVFFVIWAAEGWRARLDDRQERRWLVGEDMTDTPPLEIGLCMLQGARHIHIAALERAATELDIRINIHQLRTESDLDAVATTLNAVVLPGGESTTMRLTGGAEESGGSGLLPNLFSLLRSRQELPVLATCAGAILLCEPQDGGRPLIDAQIDRNAYGRQADSFESQISANLLEREFPGVFIRAPRFSSLGGNAKVAATSGIETVGVLTGCRLALAFHPELSSDSGFHRWLLAAAG